MQTEHPDLIVTGGNEVQGCTITEYLGVVRGIVVRAQTITQGLRGAFASILGGNIAAYEEVCETARQHAYDRMIAHAREHGANAVIADALRRHRVRPGYYRSGCLRHRGPHSPAGVSRGLPVAAVCRRQRPHANGRRPNLAGIGHAWDRVAAVLRLVGGNAQPRLFPVRKRAEQNPRLAALPFVPPTIGRRGPGASSRIDLCTGPSAGIAVAGMAKRGWCECTPSLPGH